MERSKTVVVVEDEELVLKYIRRVLEPEGFRVLSDRTAEGGYALAAAERPALVLADVQLPGADGFSLLKRLRRSPATASIPVIMMSGRRVEEEHQAKGLETGADDYLLKPFSPRHLLARVEAVLRRSRPASPPRKAARLGRLTVDFEARTVRLGKSPVRLRKLEFDLLAALLRSPGKVRSAAGLLETVWGYDPEAYGDTHTVEVHVSSLRKKLGPRLAGKIVNLPGVGYRLDP